MKCPKCNSESTYQRQYTDGYSCNDCSHDWEVPAPAVKDDARIIELIKENKQLHKTIEMQSEEWRRLTKENEELKYGGEKIIVGEGDNSITYYVHGEWVKMEWTEFIAMKFPSSVKDDWKERFSDECEIMGLDKGVIKNLINYIETNLIKP